MFTEALVKNQVSVEAHIFPEGLHGLSLANEETQITETGFGIQKRCQDWITLAGNGWQIWRDKMKFKGILFDLDGVLVHTDKLHYRAWKK